MHEPKVFARSCYRNYESRRTSDFFGRRRICSLSKEARRLYEFTTLSNERSAHNIQGDGSLQGFEMSRKYFGTDGVRGRVGQTPITPEFAMLLAQALPHALLLDKPTGRSEFSWKRCPPLGCEQWKPPSWILTPLAQTRCFCVQAPYRISVAFCSYKILLWRPSAAFG